MLHTFKLPRNSIVPFIPPCVTREKYFTTRCAQPLQAIFAHLTAVYRSCAGFDCQDSYLILLSNVGAVSLLQISAFFIIKTKMPTKIH